MLPDTTSLIARSSVPTVPRSSDEIAQAERASPSSRLLEGPAGLRGAPKRPGGATEQLPTLRGQMLTLQNQRAIDGPQSEIQAPRLKLGELLAQARQQEKTERAEQLAALRGQMLPLQNQQATDGPQSEIQAPRPKLGELLAQARQQEKTERAEEARQGERAELTQLVQSALPDGGEAMKRLEERASRAHPSTMAERWHAIRHGGPKRMEGERRTAFEALVRADLMALANKGGIEPFKAADVMKKALAEGILGQGILEKDRDLLHEVLDGFSMEHIYQKFNLKMTKATLPAFTDAQVLDRPKELGQGNMNITYEVQLRDADGAAITSVFKPLESENESFVALKSGISKDDPQIAMRNIATVAYAKKLGFDVITDTRVALISLTPNPFNPSLGLMMEMAQGEPAERVDASVLQRADVSAGVVQLQLLDHLTGQGDRHDNNYFIHVDPDGGAKVMGIDNDLCFGKELTKPEDIQRIPDSAERWAFNGTALPPVVDTDMERAILALTEGDIHAMLEDKLDAEEVKAAIHRHQGLMNHIIQLRADGLVIDPDRWADPDVQQRMTEENSYLGRELKWAQD